MSKIQTTGQLREFLSNMIVGVKNGDISCTQASNITKLAAQVNESFYSEIKVAQIERAASNEVSKMGDLPINKGDET